MLLFFIFTKNSLTDKDGFWMHLDCEIAFFVLFHSLSLKFIVSFKTQNTVVHSERIFSYEAWMVKRFVRGKRSINRFALFSIMRRNINILNVQKPKRTRYWSLMQSEASESIFNRLARCRHIFAMPFILLSCNCFVQC
ncbi:unnamed protein product [Wuchereria bancrofti]|uniref:Uncharacterized protein n=1 Tax=Wuchereria bancrofti TaxID=6293 RepID=A0A3P7F457_WUCBA|nr:unnamed protein product [Wuchereria bancrofti]